MYLSLKQAIYDVSARCQNIHDLDKRRNIHLTDLSQAS